MNDEAPEDFVPDADWLDEHSKENTGGPGGVVNYAKKYRPKDWRFVPGVSTPKES